MTDELFPYQVEGARFLAGRKHALLADQMRLGKSAQAIRACDIINAKRILVLCPAAATINWAREFQRFATPGRSMSSVLTSAGFTVSDITICSYGLATKNAKHLRGKFDVLIPDESHFLKSLDATRAGVVLGRGGLVHRADRTWFLSGTPAPNNASELWTMLYVCGATPLSFDAFVERYCKYWDGPYGRKITGNRSDTLPELRALIAKFSLRRLLRTVMPQLPKLSFQEAMVQAPPAALHPTSAREVGLAKVAPYVEMVKTDFAGGLNKLVIFCWHTDVIDALEIALAEFKPVVLDGRTPPRHKQRAVDLFNTLPACRVFIGQIIAAGTAINLSAANNADILEPDYVPGNNSQAAMRIAGITQSLPCFVRWILLDGDPTDQGKLRTLRAKTKALAELSLA